MQRAAATVLAVLALVSAPGAAEERRPPAPAPGPEALRELESRGFAVGGSPEASLVAAYRHPGRNPVFISSDAGLAVYLLLERRAADDAAFAGDELLAKDAAAWDAGVRLRASGAAGRPARFFTAVFAALAGVRTPEPDESVREAVARQLARLRGAAPAAGAVEVLETPLDEARLAALIRDAATPEQARRDAAAFWVTRVRIPRTTDGAVCRAALEETLPAGLRDRLIRDFARAGVARLRTPGADGLFDVVPVDEARFPPGILSTRPEAFGLDRGARLGSPLARRLLAARPPSPPILASKEDPSADSVAAAFDRVLAAALRTPDPRAPALFRSEAWQSLALQSVLAADAMFRRSIGPLHEPFRVFGMEELPGFVHPDPSFWEALASLARSRAATLAAEGAVRPMPSRQQIVEAIRALESCLEPGGTLPEEHRWTLRRWGVAGSDLEAIDSLESKTHTPEQRARLVEWIREPILRSLRHRIPAEDAGSEQGGVSERDRRRTPGGLLERLADSAARFAAIARSQLEGTDAEGLREALFEFGFLCEDAEGYPGRSSPHRGAAVVLDDPPRRLVHGSSGLHDLWVRYPWRDRALLARGVAFGFRAWVGDAAPDDAGWTGLLERNEARPPDWAAARPDPAPTPGK